MIPSRPGVLLALLNTLLGLVLIIGTPARTSAPSFMTAREVMPIQAWGCLFLTIGLAGFLVTRRLPAATITVLGASAHAFWAVALGAAAAADPRAALTGIVVYGWVALVHITTGIRLAEDPSRQAV